MFQSKSETATNPISAKMQSQASHRILRLNQNESKLGFSLRGGKEATGSSVGVFVSNVELDSEAQRKGLKVGDQLIQVNGLEVNSATYDEVIKLIRATPKRNDIVLMVNNVGKIPVQEKLGEPIKWVSVSVSVGQLNQSSIVGNAFAAGEISTNTNHMPIADSATNHLAAAASAAAHKLQTHRNNTNNLMAAHKTNSSKTTKSSSSDEGVFCKSITSGKGGHSNGGSHTTTSSDNELTDSAISSISQRNHLRHEQLLVSPPVSSSSGCDISISSINSTNESEIDEEDQDQDDNDDDDDESLDDTLIIVPGGQRTSETFGCGVVKGPDEWPGIFVQNVKPNSLAERVGLKPGDQLVQADGYLLSEMSFEAAIGLIKRLQLEQDELMLHVKMGAALRHLATNRLPTGGRVATSNGQQHLSQEIGNGECEADGEAERATAAVNESQWRAENCKGSGRVAEEEEEEAVPFGANNNHLVRVDGAKRAIGQSNEQKLEGSKLKHMTQDEKTEAAKSTINGPAPATVAASKRRTTATTTTTTTTTATTGGFGNSISASQVAKPGDSVSRNKANGTSVLNGGAGQVDEELASNKSANNKWSPSSSSQESSRFYCDNAKTKSNGADFCVARQIKSNVSSAAATAKSPGEKKTVAPRAVIPSDQQQLVERKAGASGGAAAAATKSMATQRVPPIEACKCRLHCENVNEDDDDDNVVDENQVDRVIATGGNQINSRLSSSAATQSRKMPVNQIRTSHLPPDDQCSFSGSLPAEDYERDDYQDNDNVQARNQDQDNEDEDYDEQREEIRIVSQNCKLHHHHLAQSFKTSQFVSEKFPIVNNQRQTAPHIRRQPPATNQRATSGLRRRVECAGQRATNNTTSGNRLQRYVSLENINHSQVSRGALFAQTQQQQQQQQLEACEYARPTVDCARRMTSSRVLPPNRQPHQVAQQSVTMYGRSSSVLGQSQEVAAMRNHQLNACCLPPGNAKTFSNRNYCCAYEQPNVRPSYGATTLNTPVNSQNVKLTNSRAATPMGLASRLVKAKSMDKLSMSITNLNYITNIGLQHQRQLAAAAAHRLPMAPSSATSCAKIYRQQHRALRCATNNLGTCCGGGGGQRAPLMSGTGEIAHESRVQLYQQQQAKVTPRNPRATTCCPMAAVSQKTQKSPLNRSTPKQQQQQQQQQHQRQPTRPFEDSECCGGSGSLIRAKNHYISSIELSQFEPNNSTNLRNYLATTTNNGKRINANSATSVTIPDCLCCSPKFLAATCCPSSPTTMISAQQTGDMMTNNRNHQQQAPNHRSRKFIVNPTDCGATTDSSGYQSTVAGGGGGAELRRRSANTDGQDPRLLRVCPIDTMHSARRAHLNYQQHAHLGTMPAPPPPPPMVVQAQNREARQRMSTFLAVKSGQQQQAAAQHRRVGGSLASDISPTCSSSASYSSPPLDSSLLSSDCSIESSLESANQHVVHTNACCAPISGLKASSAKPLKMAKRSAQASDAIAGPPAPPPLPSPDAEFDNKINTILGKTSVSASSAASKAPARELVVAASRRKQESQLSQQAKPSNRLCFVDELKLMARQQKQQQAPNSSAGANLAPPDGQQQADSGNMNNGVAKQQTDSATLIKIINANKLAASTAAAAAAANGERLACCSCNPSKALVASAAAGSRGDSNNNNNANCAKCCRQQQQQAARRKLTPNEQSEKIGAKMGGEQQRGNKLRDEHDNKRRQHEMLMKEFKSAHSRMFGKRKDSSANQNHDDRHVDADDDDDVDDHDYDEGDESSRHIEDGIDRKQQQVDVLKGIARKSNGLGIAQSTSLAAAAAAN